MSENNPLEDEEYENSDNDDVESNIDHETKDKDDKLLENDDDDDDDDELEEEELEDEEINQENELYTQESDDNNQKKNIFDNFEKNTAYDLSQTLEELPNWNEDLLISDNKDYYQPEHSKEIKKFFEKLEQKENVHD